MAHSYNFTSELTPRGFQKCMHASTTFVHRCLRLFINKLFMHQTTMQFVNHICFSYIIKWMEYSPRAIRCDFRRPKLNQPINGFYCITKIQITFFWFITFFQQPFFFSRMCTVSLVPPFCSSIPPSMDM